MGRPRLYHTLEEKKAAQRMNSSNYYWTYVDFHFYLKHALTVESYTVILRG